MGVRTVSRWLSCAVAATVLAACGESSAPSALPTSGEPVAHIHGLGVDPGDRSLLIATHSGLFRAADGETKARRVGESTQDTMGFTVTGARRYLGSGHPGIRESGPPQLGLIESRDGGRGWTPVALSGQVDFHVLRAAGVRVYGVDAGTGRLLASSDRGRNWAVGVSPGPILDLVVDPADARHLLAATEQGLQESSDGGATWRRLGARIGLLAWSSPSELHLVGLDGKAYKSVDGGRAWRETGALGTSPVALVADGDRLLAADESGAVQVSADDGRTWRLLAEL